MRKIFLLLLIICFLSGLKTEVLASEIAPITGQTTDNLNPVFLPVLNLDWKWYLSSGYDLTGGNQDNSEKSNLAMENGKWVLINLSNVKGFITRIWFAHPISANRLEEAKPPVLEIYKDNSNQPVTVDIDSLAKSNPLSVTIFDADRSSGGVISYLPISFNGKLKVLSSAPPAYWQINYQLTPASETDGDAKVFDSLWTPGNMGQGADYLSAKGLTYQHVQESRKDNINIESQRSSAIFSQTGAGIVTKILFPAGILQNEIDSLWLKVTYPDNNQASVNLPLNLVFTRKEADFTPDLPPTDQIDAYTISPTGKEIVIKGNTAWIREPYLENYAKIGIPPQWWRVSLATLFSGTGPMPPTDRIDVYSFDQNGGEHVIKADTYWYRQDPYHAWYSDSLTNAWPGSSSNGFALPHTNIEADTFSPTGAETVISAGRYWFRQSLNSPWWSDTLQNAWGLNLNRVDGYASSPMGEHVISGPTAYFRSSSANSNWSQITIESAWNSPKFYRGSLFFGYDKTNDAYYLTWPIPYWNGVNISLENRGPQPVSVTSEVYWSTDTYDQAKTGYLNISYAAGQEATDNPIFTLANITGKGKFTGVILRTRGDNDPNYNRTFLEGDDEVTVDGQMQGHGTGVEDFFNSGWYFLEGPYYLPTHGAIKSPPSRWATQIPGNSNQQGIVNKSSDSTTIAYRHLLNDAINFSRSIRITFEFSGIPLERLRQGKKTFFDGVGISYLLNPPPQPGDLNGDGQVNIADLQALLSSFTNIFNYNLVVANFGK